PVASGARVVVVAGGSVGFRRIAKAGRGVAHAVLVGLVRRGTADDGGPRGRPVLAAVGGRACGPIVARGCRGGGREGALSVLGVAGAAVVALVGRVAERASRRRANASLALVPLRAGVPVAAGRSIRLVGGRAGPRRGVAGAGVVALIGRLADHGIRS